MSAEAVEAARRWSQQSNRKRRGGTSDAAAAFKKIRFSDESRLPPAKTRQMIAAYFQENDDLIMSTYRASLICPLSKAKMSVAARGVNCKHIQCFDLESYLLFQVQDSRWACPIAGCSKETRQAQLRVDKYFCDALAALGSRPEVTDVDLLPNGDYVAVEPPVYDNVPDDGSSYIPEPLEPKHEPVDTGFNSATPSNEATAVNGTSTAEAVVVDVIVIDDEEPMSSSASCRRVQRKSGKGRRPSQKHKPETEKLLDALAKKEAELNRREEELQRAYKEIKHLREELDGKEHQDGTSKQVGAYQTFSARIAQHTSPLKLSQSRTAESLAKTQSRRHSQFGMSITTGRHRGSLAKRDESANMRASRRMVDVHAEDVFFFAMIQRIYDKIIPEELPRGPRVENALG